MGDCMWGLQLRADTPEHVLTRLDSFSSLCVTPGRLLAPGRGVVMAASRFTGRIIHRSDTRTQIGGDSILCWLGDSDGKGPKVTESVTGAVDADTMLADLFAPVTNTNGLTLGATYGLPGYPLWIELNNPDPETPRDFLDRCCRSFDWQYRQRPNGEVDVGVRGSSMFRLTPELLITEDLEGYDVPLRTVRGEIKAENTVEDYATVIDVDDGTVTGSATTLGTPPNHFDTASTAASIWKRVTQGAAGTVTDADTQAQSEVLYNYAVQNRIAVAVDLPDPRAFVEPGDNVWLYAPRSGLVRATNQVDVLGTRLFPLDITVVDMAWSWAPPMGAYAIRNSDLAVLDLSDFAVAERSPTRLGVGALWPTVRQFARRRN